MFACFVLDLIVEHKLSLSLEMDPLTTYQVKVCSFVYPAILIVWSGEGTIRIVIANVAFS